MSGLNDIIVARSTPPGKSALAVIRLSGPACIEKVSPFFPGLDLENKPARFAHFGKIFGKNGELIDEVVVLCFLGPRSFTGEDVVEISCHGSDFVVQRILEEFLSAGIRMAGPGEFTMRAFMNGKMDLARAEAVIDLIDSENRAQHLLAMDQMRGGFSKKIADLREQLIHFASLIELELDFGEEDVEFAERDDLKNTVSEINGFILRLMDSFRMGNALRKGVSTVIAGRPNAGKSTLLNALVEEDRALVSDIEGTTRDTIEEVITIEGVAFRLIDTAGIRDAGDVIEEMGIKKTMEKIASSAILLFIFDLSRTSPDQLKADLEKIELSEEMVRLVVGNKSDLVDQLEVKEYQKVAGGVNHFVSISAINNNGVEEVKKLLSRHFGISDKNKSDIILHNSRHFSALYNTSASLEKVLEGLSGNMPADLVAMDIRHAIHSLNEILGEGISSEDLLGSIFSRFCIGK
ncbi:MAG: tRNA uridine-5-carboxymethylaminomethyl(34) synthesis GTPase MnmE [Saprospirales bacterium]|nr:MAG: tRNA uridine-5-carboxymethylaminomethyl(34) synthesis GTPase MnmE [Saprospirales bacterium]